MPAEPRPRLEALTGLRALAALAVLLFHLEFLLEQTPLGGAMHPVADAGPSGVSLFFVLSGFVMTVATRATDSSGAFLRRRAARLLPAYWVAVLLAFPVMALEGTLRPGSAGQAAFTLTLLQSWLPSSQWFLAGNAVSWSLSTEIAFYLAFAVLAVRRPPAEIRVRRTVAVLVGAVAVAVLVPLTVTLVTDGTSVEAGTGWPYWLIYVSPVTRGAEFLAGCCAARLWRAGLRSPLTLPQAAGLGLVAYLLAGLGPHAMMPVGIVVGAWVLLIWATATAETDGGARALRHPWVVALGTWSYCFYLVHQLVIRLYATSARELQLPRSVVVALVPVAVLVALGAAYLLHAGVERPLERALRPRHPNRPRERRTELERTGG